MPSNQCTTSLMELGFAVGNMAGAGVCDAADYAQLEDILGGWQCRDTGDVGRLLDDFTYVVQEAQRECEEGTCPPQRCIDVWKVYNGLMKEVHPSDLEGQVTRGPVPPKVKGPKGITRTRRSAVLPFMRPADDDKNKKKNGEGEGEGEDEAKKDVARYGNGERRERWYPARV